LLTACRLIHFISGIAHFALPDPSKPLSSGAIGEEFYVTGGVSGIVIAADTVGTGHYTFFPSSETTLALALPFVGGKPPNYRIVKNSACGTNIGLLGYY